MRSGDHGSWLSYLGVGIRAFFSAQGPGLSMQQQAVRMSVLLVDNTCKEFCLLQYGVGVFQSSESIRQSVHIVLQRSCASL